MQDLTCPITSDVFAEPVIASDGHTYERSAILKWFETSNISPCTGLRLQTKGLLKNHIVLKIIDSEITRLKKMASMIDILWSYVKTLELDEQTRIIQYATDILIKKYSQDFDKKELVKYIIDVYQFVQNANIHCNMDKKQLWFDICILCNPNTILHINNCMDGLKMLILFYTPMYKSKMYEIILNMIMRNPEYEEAIYAILCEIKTEFDINIFDDIVNGGSYKIKYLTYRIVIAQCKRTDWRPPVHISNICKAIESQSVNERCLRFSHIGMAEIDLYIGDKCHTLTCTTLQATILYQLSNRKCCTFYKLAQIININAIPLAIELAGIIKCGLIINDIPVSYTDELKINTDYKGDKIQQIEYVPNTTYLRVSSEIYTKYAGQMLRFIKIRGPVHYRQICEHIKCDLDLLDVILRSFIETEDIEKTGNIYRHLI